MRTVHKQVLGRLPTQEHQLPIGSKIVAFECQGDDPVVYYLCNPDKQKTTYRFFLLKTGEDCGILRYISTATFRDGKSVFHLFMEDRK